MELADQAAFGLGCLITVNYLCILCVHLCVVLLLQTSVQARQNGQGVIMSTADLFCTRRIATQWRQSVFSPGY